MNVNYEVKIFIDKSISKKIIPKIFYAFQELFWRRSLNVKFTNNISEATIIYAYLRPVSLKNFQIWIKANIKQFDPKEISELSYLENSIDSDLILEKIKINSIDPISLTFRFLTLADEYYTESFRSDGNKLHKELPKWRKETSHLPIVEYLSDSVINILNEKGYRFQQLKNIASTLITHDCDSTNNSKFLEILYNLVKGVLRLDTNYLKFSFDGIKNIQNKYKDNINFGFEKWVKNFPELKQTFFLSFSGVGSIRHFNDPRSSASDNDFPWFDFLKIIENDNIEIGLHPGINIKKKQISYAELKYFASSKIKNKKIIGLRHHYWSINWNKMYLTYRKMVNSGFRYDCSMAYQDTFGLRAGTCMPFRPFDPEYLRPLNIYIIPTCLMDSIIVNNTNFYSNKFETMFTEIKKYGGVINLDWHTEAASNVFPFLNYLSSFKNVIDLIQIKETKSVTPSELIYEWHNRIDTLKNLSSKIGLINE